MLGAYIKRIKILILFVILVCLSYGNKLSASTNPIEGTDVLYKTNIPTTEEEIVQAKQYEEQKVKEAQERASIQRIKKPSQKTNTSVYKKVTQKAAQLSYSPCNCVTYARWRSGISVGSIGVARRHPINHSTPVVGAIGVMKYGASAAGHLFVVAAVETNGMWIDDANWVRCKVTHRFVPLSYGEGFYY